MILFVIPLPLSDISLYFSNLDTLAHRERKERVREQMQSRNRKVERMRKELKENNRY